MQWSPYAIDPYAIRTGIITTVHSLNLELAVHHVRQKIVSQQLKLDFKYIEEPHKLNKIRQACLSQPTFTLHEPLISFALTLTYTRTGVKSVGEYFTSLPATRPVEVWEAMINEKIGLLIQSAEAVMRGSTQASLPTSSVPVTAIPATSTSAPVPRLPTTTTV